LHLTDQQQHYLRRVLRLGQGDRFIAIDGQGHWWLSVLEGTGTDAHLLEALTPSNELPVAITLLVAMPKGNGMDEMIRQVTEVGVATIVPVISDRTLLNPSQQKQDRWQRIAQEASEQAERQYVPQVVAPLPLAQALQSWNGSNSISSFCTTRGHYPHLLAFLRSIEPEVLRSSNFTIAIGPEGGWTAAEVQMAIAAQYHPISLGQRILRAVTAPVVALSLIASVIEAV
jgi:16S rRNA (uracil1498-N3)-methyltransferase